jgi:hypothetical protein
MLCDHERTNGVGNIFSPSKRPNQFKQNLERTKERSDSMLNVEIEFVSIINIYSRLKIVAWEKKLHPRPSSLLVAALLFMYSSSAPVWKNKNAD